METNSQEKNVSAAFSKQAPSFDEYDEKNPILQWMRKRVQDHVLKIVKPNSKMLELNCGTGIDAVFFAQRGFHIHATDNAEGMLNELNKKINTLQLQNHISTEKISFNQLEKLSGKKYDHVFSNFGGLNCADDLAAVIKKIIPLMNENAIATLVIMPKICPWEIALLFKGNFKIAFRRFKKNGVASHLEGEHFKTYYYSPKFIKQAFGTSFEPVALFGLGSFCPPPYMEKFPAKFPKTFNKLLRMDARYSHNVPFRNWADHFVISLRMTRS